MAVTVLDRYILRSLTLNYVIGLGVMMSLYVVLDLFVNMDEFTEHKLSTVETIRNIISYYVPNLFLYFSQLSGVITLFACLLTVARTRRFNELTAVLSSGVSLYRIAVPVIIFGVATTFLLIVDTELLIPSVAHKLARRHDDVAGDQTYVVSLMRDNDGSLLSAGRFVPTTGQLHRLTAIRRDARGNLCGILEADRAVWDPMPLFPGGGRWKLERGRAVTPGKANDPAGRRVGPLQEQVSSLPRYYESSLDPKTIELRQAEQWIRFLSLSQLRELERTQPANLAAIRQSRHARIAAPIINLVLLLLGLPFFLDRSPTNVGGDAWRCLAVCGLCYVLTFFTQRLLPESGSALPAWLPIIVFMPVAIVLLDRIRT